jgi:hypothetical protein
MHQSSEKPTRHEITPEQGLGYYPIPDMEFDIINVIAEKSKALQAYDKYIRDCQPDPELSKLFEDIKAQDRRHIELLRAFLK